MAREALVLLIRLVRGTIAGVFINASKEATLKSLDLELVKLGA